MPSSTQWYNANGKHLNANSKPWTVISAMDAVEGAVAKAFLDPLHRRSTFSPSLRAHILLVVNQTVSFLATSVLLVLVVLWALANQVVIAAKRRFKPRQCQYDWDRLKSGAKEKYPRDLSYYAKEIGMDIEEQVAETDDGYFLRIHRVVNPRQRSLPDGRGPFPILLTHGLFQCSGCFVTSEERSLAFWLADQGYQVFLGNNRGVFDMGHREYSRSDPRFWDWTIRELAEYDLPAMIDHVCKVTGYSKIGLIAHSQGAGAAFISLSEGMRPDIGEKISCIVALAPAVYAGPLTTTWLFTTLGRLDWDAWMRWFGVLDFIPLMRYSYDWVPSPKLFSLIGYAMFAYLFSWTDANWLLRRKTKQFRFTPTPVSSASIFWWCGKGGFASRGCSLDVKCPKWFDSRFPPVAIYYGGQDFLVNVEALLRRLETSEPDVRVIRAQKLEQAEHCDFYYAADAVEWCFASFVEDIEMTRPRYPGEEAMSSP